MFKRTLLAVGASLAMASTAFAQAPVNSTTTPPQPTATEQGQPRPGQFNPAGGTTGGTTGTTSSTTGSSMSGSTSGTMNSSTTGNMGTDANRPMRAARADRG